MPYTADITLTDPSAPTSEEGMPSYTLPLTFDTVEEAEAAVAEHITELGRDAGSVTFVIKDEAGQPVELRGSDAD